MVCHAVRFPAASRDDLYQHNLSRVDSSLAVTGLTVLMGTPTQTSQKALLPLVALNGCDMSQRQDVMRQSNVRRELLQYHSVSRQQATMVL